MNNTEPQHYNIEQWSDGCFKINDLGDLCVTTPSGDALSIPTLIADLLEQGFRLPILIRFANILQDRVQCLLDAFSCAREQFSYRGKYTPVYPIKTNQQRTVVETLLTKGVGLEAGSKSEMLAVLALLTHYPGSTIICNGYKDREYIRLALIAKALGHRVYIIIEMLSELDIVMQEVDAMGIAPLLGIRVRLSSIAKGKWQNTGGEKSKFGLTASQVQAALALLKKHHYLESLQVLHCHLGSQISNIRHIQRGMNECARYFVALRKAGANIKCVDVGGGLGVDYDGTNSRHDCSINYSWQEYANNVVQTLQAICDEQKIEHPDIITESGRALTAHHAMLVTNIIDVEIPIHGMPEPQRQEHPLLVQMREAVDHCYARNAVEIYHEMQHWIEEVYQLFNHGVVNIVERAQAEQLLTASLFKVRDLLNVANRNHRTIDDEISEKLAAKVFCNLSVFQSIPDAWAINQVFPILPLSQLNEAPSMRSILQDLTCDSDGRVDRYVTAQGVESSLPLPRFNQKNPYLLGFFMVGAYQEILGDMHNLFGDTDAVHVELTADGLYRIVQQQSGDNSADLLAYVNFDSQAVMEAYQQQISCANLDAAHKIFFTEVLAGALHGYTYLEDE